MEYRAYRVYMNYVKSPADLLLGAFSTKADRKDALAECLTFDPLFGAKVRMLYETTLANRISPKEFVNILYHEDGLSILELKKKSIRLTFFKDTEVNIAEIRARQAIVFLSYFKKEKWKTPIGEIDRARKLRDIYLTSKREDNLTLEVIE